MAAQERTLRDRELNRTPIDAMETAGLLRDTLSSYRLVASALVSVVAGDERTLERDLFQCLARHYLLDTRNVDAHRQAEHIGALAHAQNAVFDFGYDPDQYLHLVLYASDDRLVRFSWDLNGDLVVDDDHRFVKDAQRVSAVNSISTSVSVVTGCVDADGDHLEGSSAFSCIMKPWATHG